MDSLEASAAGAYGLVTRAHARRFLSEQQLRTRLKKGVWKRVFPAVYRIAGAPESWRQRVEAAMLWAGHGAVLSHRSAAVLHGFEQFPEGPIDLTLTRQVRAPEGITVFRAGALPPRTVVTLEEWSVTNATRTLIDLAASTDRPTLRLTFDQALREKKTTLEDLARAIRRAKRRPGVVDLRELLGDFEGEGGPTESVLERDALDLVIAAGLPRPKLQWGVVAGRKQRRLDLFFRGVVVEVDGYASHSGIDRFEDDRLRNNSLTAGGLRVLHWTWRAQQERPEELIAELYVALNLPR